MKRVLVIEDDAATLQRIHTAFLEMNVDAVSAADWSAGSNGWSAAVVDLNLPHADGLDIVRRMRANGCRIPIVALSQAREFPAKIAALRAGADAYYEKNDDWHALASHVVLMTQRPEGARVLIVEDDAVAAAATSDTLRAAGYSPLICGDGSNFEETLIEWGPDLVLMDISLPDVDGIELTRFLRQDERFETIPVIYLTALSGIDDSVRAALSGGERVLTKPVPPDVLVAAVASRLEHFRRLRTLLEHDVLTGVLTRRAFVERSASIISAASRDATQRACLAMIDLDRFKSINDRFGHPAGDRVLIALCETLRCSLRSTDVVGRYGGEEFVVLLHDASERDAVPMIERAMNRFRLVQHRVTAQTTFAATFSAGVAALARGEQNVAGWIERADRALLRAKAAGRDRVLAAAEGVGAGRPHTLDSGTVAGLRALGPNSGYDVFGRVVELFITLTPKRLDVLRTAIAAHDGDLVRRESHALRGAAGTIGLAEMTASCAQLERIARESDWACAQEALDHLQHSYAAAREALRRTLNES